MRLLQKFKNISKQLLVDKKQPAVDINETIRSLFSNLTNDDNPIKKINELEALIYQLGGKITVLVEKVQNLDKQITQLSTIHEELMYTIDQEISVLEEKEDKSVNLTVNSKEKKFGLN